MLTHEEFGQLRLSQFVPEKQITPLTDWEFLDRLWIGEAVGFSEWLRPEERADVLESLALDMEELPEEVVHRVLAKIGLPVRKGLTEIELTRLLGKPRETQAFVDDRKTFDFQYADPDPYRVSCTVLNDGGLIYLVVTVERRQS